MTLAHYTMPMAYAASKTVEALSSTVTPLTAKAAHKPRPTAKPAIHRIIEGDCLDLMAKIPDRSIDFICADFPYNISGKGGLTMKGHTLVAADFGEWDKYPSEQAYLDFVFKVCTEYRRLLKPNASMVLFFGYKLGGWIAHELQRRGLCTFRMPLIWAKDNPQPSYKKTSFRSAYEMGLWLVNDGGTFAKPRTFNFQDQNRMSNVWHYLIGREGYKRTNHPTEKPELLTRRLIEIFTHPGDIVLDTFAGGGTTGVAAYLAGRHAISIEREPGFIKMIHSRQQAVERMLKRKGL